MGKRRIITAAACLIAGAGIGIGISDMTKKKTNAAEPVLRHEIEIKDGHYTAEAMLSLGRLSDPQVSPDGKWILYGVSYTSVEENKAVRNLYVCSIDGSENQLLTRSDKSISNARWCNGGKDIVYLKGGQIYKCSVQHKGSLWKTGKEVQMSNWEKGIGEFAISADEGLVMFTSTVKSSVSQPSDIYSDLDKAKAYETDNLMYRHWDHWVEEIPHTYINNWNLREGTMGEGCLDILGSEGTEYELPTEPFGGIEQLCFSPCGRFVAYSCRKLTGIQYAFSTCTDIFIYDILTGATTAVTDGGGYDTDPVWSPDGSKIAWLSMARNGYEADKTRLMYAEVSVPQDPDCQCMIQVGQTKELTNDFKYNVSGPVWSSDSKFIWFNALAEGLQGIFKASLEGTIERITGENDWHDYSSPFYFEGNAFLATWQSMEFPTEIVKVSPEGSTQITNENGHILSQLPEPKMEARQIKTVDGKDMLTWVVYPPDFDESKTYPAILICLGGPQGTLSQSWSYRWNYRLMASQGYIVILPNRRGTTAFGQEWTEQISGDYSGLNIQDYLSAAKVMKEEPYVGKMAACGASYGGYSVYYLMGMHENTFDCFIAHAGIFNEEHMYYTTEELWFPNWDNGGLTEYSYDENAPAGPAGDGITFGGMQQAGSPWSTSPKAVRHYANSPHKLVQNWHTPILCIHGGSDFRVPVDEGMAAFNCAQMMGVPSRLIVFPDENHWILKPQNALFWHREYFKWLDQWCK